MLNIYCSNIEPIGKSSNYPAGNHFARLIAQLLLNFGSAHCFRVEQSFKRLQVALHLSYYCLRRLSEVCALPSSYPQSVVSNFHIVLDDASACLSSTFEFTVSRPWRASS
jgi:hypothetical protein